MFEKNIVGRLPENKCNNFKRGKSRVTEKYSYKRAKNSLQLMWKWRDACNLKSCVQQWGGGQRWEGSLTARGPYGLNDVQWWGLEGFGWNEGDLMWGEGLLGGEDVGGGGVVEGVQPQRIALHTISIGLQNSFCESHSWRLLSWKALRN